MRVELCSSGVFCGQTGGHYLLLVAPSFGFETRGDWGELKVLSGSRVGCKLFHPLPVTFDSLYTLKFLGNQQQLTPS